MAPVQAGASLQPNESTNTARRLIPGAYERNTANSRQSGTFGGAAFGTDGLANAQGAMAAATITEREKEGGGGASQRPQHDRA